MRTEKKFYGPEGYLTVYAALTIAVLLSLFFSILEGIRYHTMQMETELIADVATESALAEYHRELLRQYGVFFVDTSYGEGIPSAELLREHVEWYAGENCNMREVFLGNVLYKDFMDLCVEDLSLTSISLATDAGGSLFRKQAAEAVKDEVGVGLLDDIVGWLDIVEKYDLTESDLETEKNHLDQEIAGWNGKKVQAGEDWVTVEIENPTQTVEEVRRQGILRIVTEEGAEISGRTVDLQGLFSSRKAGNVINQGNTELAEKENFADRLLWQEYLLRYLGCYGKETEKSVLKYQMEYLIGGKDNDTENLRSTVNRICLIREAANMMYLVSDTAKKAEAEAAAMLIASAAALPELQPVLQAVIMLGWAYAESLHDMRCLMSGQRVPLLKDQESWYCGLSGVLTEEVAENGFEMTDDAKSVTDGKGLSYCDYLRILLALCSLEEQTDRVFDLVEMDIRETPGNGAFRIDGCVSGFETAFLFGSGYGYSFQVYKRKEYQKIQGIE